MYQVLLKIEKNEDKNRFLSSYFLTYFKCCNSILVVTLFFKFYFIVNIFFNVPVLSLMNKKFINASIRACSHYTSFIHLVGSGFTDTDAP